MTAVVTTAVLPKLPLITVAVPVLVAPVPPPKFPNCAALLRGTATVHRFDAPVVKVHVKGLASALPARSWTPVVTVAVYWVLGARFEVGVRVEVLLGEL